MLAANAVVAQFRVRYGAEPRVFQAPGRINLIGEHTDYNQGFVLPAAINLRVWVAAAPSESRRVVVYSTGLDESAQMDLVGPTKPQRNWSDYVFGVASHLAGSIHPLSGANLLVASDVPIGAGLSSSAAIEVATALALTSIWKGDFTFLEIALLCQASENMFVGARVGIMDHFASCFGRAGHAILLDCRSLEAQHLAMPDVAMVVCNTMVRHALAAGEYNRRHQECEEAVAILSRGRPAVNSLRDVSLQSLIQGGEGLPAVLFRRARHVITENERVIAAASAIGREDVNELGRLMSASHRSLRDDYEVSCPELEAAVNVALDETGVLGSRMMGGGFGGSTISLVQRGHVDAFRRNLEAGYRLATGRNCETYLCTAAAGAAEEFK